MFLKSYYIFVSNKNILIPILKYCINCKWKPNLSKKKSISKKNLNNCNNRYFDSNILFKLYVTVLLPLDGVNFDPAKLFLVMQYSTFKLYVMVPLLLDGVNFDPAKLFSLDNIVPYCTSLTLRNCFC